MSACNVMPQCHVELDLRQGIFDSRLKTKQDMMRRIDCKGSAQGIIESLRDYLNLVELFDVTLRGRTGEGLLGIRPRHTDLPGQAFCTAY